MTNGKLLLLAMNYSVIFINLDYDVSRDLHLFKNCLSSNLSEDIESNNVSNHVMFINKYGVRKAANDKR